MIANIKKFIFSVSLLAGIAVATLALPTGVNAQSAIGEACNSSGSASVLCSGESQDQSAGDIVTTVINVLLYIVGIIAVIMVIIGGIMYAVSAGDSGAVTKAKNTILYAIVGLIIAFIAFAIVNWVADLF